MYNVHKVQWKMKNITEVNPNLVSRVTKDFSYVDGLTSVRIIL